MQLNNGNINGMICHRQIKMKDSVTGRNKYQRKGRQTGIQQIRDYLDLLSSDAPAPGGGSVSALSAAQGAASGGHGL